MKKICFIVVLVLALSAAVCAQQARNIELVDVPTANTLIKGEVRIDIKLYPGGGILSRLYIGIFDRLMLGGAFNVENIIGTGDVNVVFPPKLLGKLRFTDDDGAVPAISLGYEGEGYSDVPPRGAFISITKEFNAGITFQLSGVVYTNEFTNFGQDIRWGTGIAFAITREFIVSAEYDGLFGAESAHINFGIGYFFDPIEIDVAIKYGLGEYDNYLSRTLKILYITFF